LIFDLCYLLSEDFGEVTCFMHLIERKVRYVDLFRQFLLFLKESIKRDFEFAV